MANLENLVEEIKKLTVMEVNELVKKLEEEFGVSAAAQMVAGPAAGAAGAAAEEKNRIHSCIKRSWSKQTCSY